jgi:hypothetical protein
MAPAHHPSRPLIKKQSLLDPISSVPWAFRAPPFSSFNATGHFDTLAINKCICNLAAGFVKIAPCSLAGDPEFFSGFFLFKSFEINESYQLNFLGLERDSLTLILQAAWLVAPRFGCSGYGAPEPGPSASLAFVDLRFFTRCHLSNVNTYDVH